MKKKKNISEKSLEKKEIYDQNIVDVDLGVESEEYCRIFAANINILRHAAWIASGLKVGETRLLYTLYKMKATPDRLKEKVSTITGDVMKIHPHGDTSIYNTAVSLGRPWSTNIPLIEAGGSFGNPKGKGASASRYIEASLSQFAIDCFFKDFDEKVVDMKPSYSNKINEPEFVLPARVPYLLINNTFSIGKGASCSLFPANINDVIDLTLKLMDNPLHEDCTLYPDIPSGCDVIDDGQFKEICETGVGSFRTRGTIEVHEEENMVRITSTPLFYNLFKIQDQLESLESKKEIACIDKLIDEEDESVDFRIILKPGTDPYKFKHLLYKKTGMEDSHSVVMRFIDNYSDHEYNIRSIILTWLDYRRDYKRRLLNVNIVKYHERLHILEIILQVLNSDNGEKAIKIIRKTSSRNERIEKLMKAYKITSLQASEICSMTISEFSKDAKERYINEQIDIKKKLPILEDTIRDIKKLDKVIKEELLEMKQKYGYARKSKLVKLGKEQTVIQSNHTLIFSNEGRVKKLPENINTVGNLPEGDYPVEIYKVSNAEEILLFDSTGMVTKVLVSDIPGCTQDFNGNELKKLYPGIKGKIVAIKPTQSEDSKSFIVFITKNGISKKTPLNEYIGVSKTTTAINIKDGDELVSVKIIKGNKSLIIYTTQGNGIRLSSSDIKEASRGAIGNKCITIADTDNVIGADIIQKDEKGIFVLTTKGNVKISDLAYFPKTGKETLKIISLCPDETIAKIKTVKCNETFIIFMKNNAPYDLDISSVGMSPRLAKGKKMVPVRKGDMIIEVKERK